jgi:hypothetical protein
MTMTLALILIIGLDLAVLALVMLTVHLPFRLRDAAEPHAAATRHAAAAWAMQRLPRRPTRDAAAVAAARTRRAPREGRPAELPT